MTVWLDNDANPAVIKKVLQNMKGVMKISLHKEKIRWKRLKIFLDTNFIMDLLARDGEVQADALKVLEEGAKMNLRFYVSFLTLANFAYITRKEQVLAYKTNY